ncbi:Chk1 protein kinase [Batrachochytrium dendrobatidis]
MISEPYSILGYELGDIIGEGAQGRHVFIMNCVPFSYMIFCLVRLAVKSSDMSLAAVKIASKFLPTGAPANLMMLRKEVKIHEAVSHENIIKLFATGEDDAFVYLAMEYAASGELFDLIQPDVGIDEDLAHLYFHQLVSGMDYLHTRGISHRDLKPENMLLDDLGNLKISDFGLATVFKHKNIIRTLTTPCGTPPYVAPEIHAMKYDGAQVDIWSSGIILYVLLAGNTPWGEPTFKDPEFKLYYQQYPHDLDYSPWNSFSSEVLELICGLLTIDPQKRYTLEHIQHNSWFEKENILLTDGRCNNPTALAKRLREKLGISSAEMLETTQLSAIAFSQPMDMRVDGDSPDFLDSFKYIAGGINSFSQPLRMGISQSPTPALNRFTDTASQIHQKKIVNIFPSDRMTRFYSSSDAGIIFTRISETLQQFLVPYKIHQKLLKIVFSTVDRRKCQLHGEISIQRATDECHIVLFRKSKVKNA